MRRLLVLLALLGCSTSKPEGRPRLVSDAEAAQLEATVMSGLQAPSCPPDDAGKKLIEPPPAIAACVQPLVAGKSRDLVEARDPVALEAVRTCGADLTALLDVVGTRGRCSPYQVGHSAWGTFATSLVIAHVIELRSRLRAEAGDVRGALDLLTRLATFGQNLGRGRTGIVPAMIGAEIATSAATTAGAILGAHPLSGVDRDALVAAVDAMLADRPPFIDVLRGELEAFALQDYLPRLKPVGWVPPGGWHGGTAVKVPPVTPGYLDVREEGAFLLRINRAQLAAYVPACPATATVKECRDGLAKLTGAGAPDLSKLLGDLGRESDPAAGTLRVRQSLTEALVSVGTSAYVPYAIKSGATSIRWGAVRLHLEILRTGRCPTEDDLAAQPFVALRSPPGLGDAMVVTVAPEAITIAPPAWVESKREPYRIACPSIPK